MLPLLQFALNDAYYEATSSTPFWILLGQDSRSPLDFAAPSETNSLNGTGYEPDTQLKQKLDEVNRFIQEYQDEVIARMKSQADRYCHNYTFEPGDQVLLSTKSHPALVGNRKQQDLQVGPFVVKQRINNNIYELEELPPAVPSTQNITFLSPFHPNIVRFSTRPPEDVALPEIIEDSIEWEVNKVTDFRQVRDRSWWYKVKWIGVQQEQCVTIQSYERRNRALVRTCFCYEQKSTEPLHVTIVTFTVIEIAGCHYMTSNHNTGGRKLVFIHACGPLAALCSLRLG